LQSGAGLVNCPTAGNVTITLVGQNFKCDSAITVTIGELECVDPILITVSLPHGPVFRTARIHTPLLLARRMGPIASPVRRVRCRVFCPRASASRL
jgi:hypothetical protein